MTFLSKMSDIEAATQRAIKESKLKKEASDRTTETDHCQQYLDDLHTVMDHRPDQSEY
jgi:hypothetical protein